MKIILNEDIEHLGRLGNLVEVKPGYARNYLFPRGLALQPTGHNLEMMKHKKIKAQKRLELEKLSALDQKQKLEELTLTIKKKAGESDTLFGSVTTIEIQQKLEEMSTNIDRKKLHLDEPIKKLGHHVCKVKLIEDVEAELKIEVVRENEETEDNK
jgi:large subunit ribosomal protein L9